MCGLTQQGTDDIGTAVSTVQSCNSGSAAFFGAGGAADTPATVCTSGVTIAAAAASTVCCSPVAEQLLSFTRPLAAAASAAGAITPAYLGVSSDANVAIAQGAAVFAGPTVHVGVTQGGAQLSLPAGASVRVVLPLTVDPAMPPSAVLLLPEENATSTAGARRASVAGQDAGTATSNYSVTCPSDASMYTGGAVSISSGCTAGDHTVSCEQSEAGGVKFGACPVDAFTAACVSYDGGSASWSADKCEVTDVSNDYLACECSGVGAFSPSFATRGATTHFRPASSDGNAGDGNAAADEDDDDSFGAGPIVAVVLVAAALVLVAIVVINRRRTAASAAAQRSQSDSQRVAVPGAGATAQRVDAADASAAGDKGAYDTYRASNK